MQSALVEQRLAIRARMLDAQDRLLEAERSLQTAQNRANELRKELGSLEAEKTARLKPAGDRRRWKNC